MGWGEEYGVGVARWAALLLAVVFFMVGPFMIAADIGHWPGERLAP